MECSFFPKEGLLQIHEKKGEYRANSFSARAPFASSLFGWDKKEDRGLEVANSCGHDDKKYQKMFINWGRIYIGIKVHIFWEGQKILRNLHLTFDWHYIGQK